MTEAIRVLYAEDNPQDADQTVTHFRLHAPEFEIEVVDTGQRSLERLSAVEFDLFLLDHHLPDMDGLDVLKSLLHRGVRVPVVLVTGVGDEQLVVKALRMGAANYVPKAGGYLESLPELLRGLLQDHHRKQSQGAHTSPLMRILYVEHVAMDIELTVHHFAEAAPHFVVDSIRSGAEALVRLEQAPTYDLVLIDLRMPDMSGIEFSREARRRRIPLPPFIMVTGKGDETAAIATLMLGAADYVIKRDDYLIHLVYAIQQAIAHDRISRLNERLQALSRRLLEVQETDRRQLAAELHDELGQALTVAKINLQSLQRFPDTAAEPTRLEESITSIDRALQQVRSLSLKLRPPMLDDLGMLAALHWLMDQSRGTGLSVELTVDGPDARFDANVEAACFRVAQEALTNIGRHARAKHIVVSLREHDGRLHLRVRDDGIGFDVAAALKLAARGASLGLLGMEERAKLTGGDIEWRSAPDQGTEVYAWFSLDRSRSPGAKATPVA